MSETLDQAAFNTPATLAPLLNPRTFNTMTRLLVSGLIICLGLWITGAIVDLLRQLYIAATGEWSHGAEKMITDVVIILAILELVRTLQSYLELGRVKVTLILDAALVVLIGELISLWYREYTTQEVLLSLAVITLLTLLRIVTMRYSPENHFPCDEGPQQSQQTDTSQ
ncbi:MAG: phosphate-starvation-inducible PsiE family protein [Candidatus Thiodiazotropha sp.]|nr:phosphate-starvation-inducible PsiE family protein [Candidatus Thiodiazotropha taylori]MBT3058087.1 phosphate-starvation-inducible PsiE family protein [Candidatus Thiodiazotropha sp. (ex Lucina pensylvanica)]MBT3062743.1 phosphate-starvation-inducible PsiE family protein [Candidatus Thiodiazotropha sp. (ex Lucina pensylvanica)]MBV2093612.1 phosphate-starvation-inducible PsiE family protein [Candidatus Thiodiazotropha sp. (ex Codakia orbicularis)]PUB77228.1 MAG: hypothetical protein DBO99_108